MEEWKEYRLGDICSRVCSGGTPSSRHDEYYGGNIPWLNTKEVDFKPIYNTEKKITQEGLENSSAKWIEENTIVVAMYGATAGKTAIAKIPLTTNQACCNLTINPTVADYRFVYYSLANKFNELASLANGGAQQNLNAQIIKDFVISLPGIYTQKFIANILSSLDEKIENNRKINSNLEEQAKALFKSWFIDFEPFKGGKFVESELGKIPEGWEVVTIGEVTDNIKEKVCDRDSIKVLSPVTSGHLVLSEEYFSKQVFSSSIAKYIVVKHNDFAYNPARINIGSIGMNEFEFDGCVSPVYVVFRCQSGYEYFFDLYRRTSYFIEEVKKRAIGGVRQTLSYKDLSLIQLIYPPKKVVDAFNFIYISFIHEIHSNDVSNKKLEAIRDALLPKLMSGEIDVR